MNPFYKILTFVYTEKCPYCRAMIDTGKIACPDCLEEIRRKHIPIKGGAGGNRCVSSFIYGGRVRKAIHRIKFFERIQYLPQIAYITAHDIRGAFPVVKIDFITAVPMHPDDRKKQGYNHAELFAKALGKEFSLPYLDALEKIKRTEKQHKLTYTQRKTNLNGAFKVIDKELINGKSILLIDDVITTGATLAECCKALKRAKPVAIYLATIASARNDYPEDTII